MSKNTETLKDCISVQEKLQQEVIPRISTSLKSTNIPTEEFTTESTTSETEQPVYPLGENQTKKDTTEETVKEFSTVTGKRVNNSEPPEGLLKRIESLERKIVLLANQLQANQEYIVAEKNAKQQNVQRGGGTIEIDTSNAVKNYDACGSLDFLFESSENPTKDPGKKKYKLSK